MKTSYILIVLTICLGWLLASCEKAPYLTINSPINLHVKDSGGTESISFSCNRAWTISSSEDWVHVSPTKGDANETGVSASISCDSNTTYDSRSASVTILCEGLSETITVTQDTNYGIISSPTNFNLTKAAQTIEVEVKANVQYDVTIGSSCRDWISEAGTKALSSTKLVFYIAANDTYDNREGKITIKEKGGSLSQVIVVKQSQTDDIILTENDFSIDGDEQMLEIEVNSNVTYSVEIDPSASSWLSHVETKALSKSTLVISVSQNDGAPRMAKIIIKQTNGEIAREVQVYQKTAIVKFDDEAFKAFCIDKHDQDGDGEISMTEAKQIIELDFNRYKAEIKSLKGIEAFINLKNLYSIAFACQVSSLDLSRNMALSCIAIQSPLTEIVLPETPTLEIVYLYGVELEKVDLSQQTNAKEICLSGDNIRHINLSANPLLHYFGISRAPSLSSIDFSNNPQIDTVDIWDTCIESLSFDNNKNLSALYLGNDKALGKVDVSENKKLTDLQLYHLEKITELDLSNCLSLKYFNCEGNSLLTDVDLSACNSLRDINAQNNPQLHSIVLASHPELSSIHGDNNDLFTMDISGAPNILSSDFRKNPNLKRIYVFDNFWSIYDEQVVKWGAPWFTKDAGCYFYITGDEDLELPADLKAALISSANSKPPYVTGYVHTTDLNGDGEISRKEALLDIDMELRTYANTPKVDDIESTDWLQYFPNLKNLQIVGTKITNIDLSKQSKLEFLFLGINRQLQSVDVSHCLNLETFYLNGNALDKIDLSTNTKLREFSFSGNIVKGVFPIFGDNSKLEYLTMVDAGLNSFDASMFPNLQSLEVYTNNLSSLDLSSNTLIRRIRCDNNHIPTLDLSANPLVEEFTCNSNGLSSVNVDGCSNLVFLECKNNNLLSLDISTCAREMYQVKCNNNPNLSEIWLKIGQSFLQGFEYDKDVTTIKYKD